MTKPKSTRTMNAPVDRSMIPALAEIFVGPTDKLHGRCLHCNTRQQWTSGKNVYRFGESALILMCEPCASMQTQECVDYIKKGAADIRRMRRRALLRERKVTVTGGTK